MNRFGSCFFCLVLFINAKCLYLGTMIFLIRDNQVFKDMSEILLDDSFLNLSGWISFINSIRFERFASY